jgi:hypothetical protein
MIGKSTLMSLICSAAADVTTAFSGITTTTTSTEDGQGKHVYYNNIIRCTSRILCVYIYIYI